MKAYNKAKYWNCIVERMSPAYTSQQLVEFSRKNIINWTALIERPYTFHKDFRGEEIYAGDILMLRSGGAFIRPRQVFWDENHLMWMLDNSNDQDRSNGIYLKEELNSSELYAKGNIYQHKRLIWPDCRV